MKSSDKASSSKTGQDIGNQAQGSDLAARSHSEVDSILKNSKENDNIDISQDPEAMELYSRYRAQEDEILFLRQQIALASIKESQMLNEKYALERKFSELRMALDEQQNEAVTTASNELARRKHDLEENLRLVNELKITEDERSIFTSSMIGLLAEYGVWPRVTNASALANNVKHLHDQLQTKIRTAHTGLAQFSTRRGDHSGDGTSDTHSSNPVTGQLPSSSMGAHGFSSHNQYIEQGLEPVNNASRIVPGPSVGNLFDGSGLNGRSEERSAENLYVSHLRHDGVASYSSEEEGPGIDGFQIIGDAKPGGRLLGCGFPVRGTSLCMFQWVRHYLDGTREYIDGATNPEYVVTADDVDKLIAVECIPMDEQGRQGDLVRLFANDQNKISCDPDMQLEIDTYISNGHATFSVLMLIDSSDNWEPATLFLRRSSFQVKIHRTQAVEVAEKYSRGLSIKIPSGLSSQFVITSSSGTPHPFSTNDDVRNRDVIVLTMRIFQSKALDEKRKGKA